VGHLGRRSTLALVTALALAGAGAGVEAAAATPIHVLPSATSEAVGGVSPSHHGIFCVLPTGRWSRPGRGGGQPSTGTITAVIPRTVFIRAEGGALVVSTNTGWLPTRGDEFYLIARGHATPASGRLRWVVEHVCAAQARRHRPHRG
jgi:hypothetical protein